MYIYIYVYAVYIYIYVDSSIQIQKRLVSPTTNKRMEKTTTYNNTFIRCGVILFPAKITNRYNDYVWIHIYTYIGNKQFAKSYTVYVHNIPSGKLT